MNMRMTLEEAMSDRYLTKRSSAHRNEQRDRAMRKIFARPGWAGLIAKQLGISLQTVSVWNRVPAHHVLDIAPLIRMKPQTIRPDIFGSRKKTKPTSKGARNG